MTRLGNSDAYISAKNGVQIIADNEDEDDEICDVVKLEKDFTNKFKNVATSPENVIKGTFFHTMEKIRSYLPLGVNFMKWKGYMTQLKRVLIIVDNLFLLSYS